MAPRPLCELSLCLLFLSQPFITTTALLKMYPPLFGEQIWKSGFWRYQNHLFLKLAAQAVNAALGWIFSVDPYFSEQAILLSSTRNNEIFNVLWKKLKYFESTQERKLHALIGNCCREPLWWYRRETCGTRALWSPSVLSFPTEPVVSH